MTERTRWASPEWVVPNRDDALLVPSLADSWSVGAAPLIRGASYTDFSSHRMSVPTGDEPSAVAVRVHEMIHATVSPANVPGELLRQLELPPEAVTLAEEVRVNLIASLTSVGDKWPELREGSDGSEVTSAEMALARNDWRAALTVFLGTLGMNVHAKVRRRLRRKPEWKRALTRIEKLLNDEGWWAEARYFRPKYCHLSTVRSYLRNVSSTMPVEYRYSRPGPFGTLTVESAILPSGFVAVTLPLAAMISTWTEFPPRPDGETKSTPGDPDDRDEPISEWVSTSGVPWVEMKLGITSLTESTSRFVGKRKRPSMTGKAPRRPDRLLTDPERRIFSETVRGNGGVVVFDCSGSMRVDWEVVNDVTRQFAGATVIAYSATRSGQGANTWVLAKNGRMISPEGLEALPLGRGNGVDGPVLRWALRHRKKPSDFVLWVTDGGVTGTNDQFSDDLLKECASICRRHRVTTARDAAEALDLLRQTKTRGAMPYTQINEITRALRSLDHEGME